MTPNWIAIKGFAREALVPPSLLVVLAGALLSTQPIAAAPAAEILNVHDHAGHRLITLQTDTGEVLLLDEGPGRLPRMTGLGVQADGPVVSHFATGPDERTFAAFAFSGGVHWLELGELARKGSLQPSWLGSFGTAGPAPNRWDPGEYSPSSSAAWWVYDVVIEGLTASPPTLSLRQGAASATFLWDGTQARRLLGEEPVNFE